VGDGLGTFARKIAALTPHVFAEMKQRVATDEAVSELLNEIGKSRRQGTNLLNDYP
jgi:hypothetical protein